MSVVAPVPSGKDKTPCQVNKWDGVSGSSRSSLDIDIKSVSSLQRLLLQLMQLTTRHMLA